MRHYLRQEPYAANPLVRIREGGNLQRLSLPRHNLFQELIVENKTAFDPN